jgi:hypothetical protein
VTDEPTATGAHRAPARGPSRRAFLVGGGIAVVVGSGAGVAAELLQPEPVKKRPPAPPAVLVAALAQERALIASLDVALAASGAPLATLTQVRTDHVAHEQALVAALSQAAGPGAASPSPSPTRTTRPPALTTAELQSAEKLASSRAAVRAAGMTGRNATLLASIAACEATHVELLE